MRLHDVTAARSAVSGGPSSLSGAWQSLLSSAWSSLGQTSPGGGVQDLAEALKAALVRGNSSGRNLAPALAKALNAGLEKAAQTLTGQGVSASHVARLVASFRGHLSDALDALDPPDTSSSADSGEVASDTPGSSGASGSTSGAAPDSGPAAAAAAAAGSTGAPGAPSAQTSQGAYVDRESGTLRITTADGDRVAIRFRQTSFLAVPGGSAAAAGGTGNAASNSPATGSAAAGNAITSGRVQISVRGSLDADEVKAIDDLLSQVESLGNQFFAGDLQDAFGAAAALNADPGEIARFSLHLSYTQLGIGSLASAAPTGTGTAANAGGGVGAAAGSGAVSSANATGADTAGGAVGDSGASSGAAATSGTDGAAAGASAAGASSAGNADAGTNSGAGVTSGTGTGTGTATGSSPAPSAASAQQTIGSFIQNVLGKLASASGGSSFNFSMKWKLELLATALPSYAPTPQDAAAPSTQLASATLKSLAN